MNRGKTGRMLLEGLPVEEELDMMLEEEVLYRDPGDDFEHIVTVYHALKQALRRERDKDSRRLRSRRVTVSQGL